MRFLLLLVLLSLFTGCTSNSPGDVFDDARNESLAKKRISDAHPGLAAANVSVTSFNGVVLLTGQVSAKELIQIASAEVEPLRNVRKVHNELTVAGETSLLSRTNDSWLTTKVKSSLSTNMDTDASRIKVVTENGVVYLMGLVTRQESEDIVKVAADIQGIQKIVKVFEYIN